MESLPAYHHMPSRGVHSGPHGCSRASMHEPGAIGRDSIRLVCLPFSLFYCLFRRWLSVATASERSSEGNDSEILPLKAHFGNLEKKSAARC